MDPLPTPMLSSQPTVNAAKIPRRYSRLHLEVSLPHLSSRKKTASEQKENATRINVREGSQPIESDEGTKSLEKGWNDGWPGQWDAKENVGTSLTTAIDHPEIQDLPNNTDVSPDNLERKKTTEEGKQDEGDMEMEVEMDGCLALPTRPTYPSFQQDHDTPTAKIVNIPKHYERIAPITSSSSFTTMPTFSSLRTGSPRAIGTIASYPDLLIPRPNDLGRERHGIEQNEFGRGLKRKLVAWMDDDENGDGERQDSNGLGHAVRSGQSTSRLGHGMRERSLDRAEENQVRFDAESTNQQTGALEKVDMKDDSANSKRKGKEKAVNAGDSSSINGRASSSVVRVEERETTTRPRPEEEMGFEGSDEIGRYLNVPPIGSGIPTRVVVPAITPTTGDIPRNVLPCDAHGPGKAKFQHFPQAEASTSKAVEPTPQSEYPTQCEGAPPQSGTIPIDSFLADNKYDGRGRRRDRKVRKAPDLGLAYPPRAVVGHLQTLDEIDNIYVHLQLAPLVHLNEVDGAFLHGTNIWDRVFHPNVKQLLLDQDVVYPVPVIDPVYPPEADVIKFQFDKWGAQARVASYKACILGGSASDNLAMKYLLERRFGRDLSLGYSSPLIQVLASKLDAFGRLGMVDGVSPCRILSTSCLGRGDRGGVITRDLGNS
jgi:hypothetical protein